MARRTVIRRTMREPQLCTKPTEPRTVRWVGMVTLGKKWFRLAPSKAACRQATFLEKSARAAGAKIVAAQLFFEELFAVNDPHASFDVHFGRIASPPFAHRLKRTPVLGSLGTAWDTFAFRFACHLSDLTRPKRHLGR